MKRKIIDIDEKKCNGCGLCVNACHENAIELLNGKAQLISDEYCDGLGDCLPECPEGAINIIERESKDYDKKLVIERKKEKDKHNFKISIPCGCPGTAARSIDRTSGSKVHRKVNDNGEENGSVISELRQWPVQLKLINPKAAYLKNANLLVAADCTAYAYANFHEDFIKDHIVVIGCPKLDDISCYEEKLIEIIKNTNLKSITVVRMEVPCCGGIVNAVKNSMLKSGIIVPYKEVVISTEGESISE
ncbi:ATP-binding protein [Clostridium sp. JNZ X4-2]